MRPYWAIVKDSFREAVQSRVLLVLLSITTVLLLGLAPIGISEQLGGYFLAADLLDPQGLLEQIERQQTAKKPSPGKQIWRQFSDDFKARLADRSGSARSKKRQPSLQLLLPKELNRVIRSRELYDAQAWADVRLSRQAEDSLKLGGSELSEEQLSHFNRLLLEAAFPGKIAHSRPQATYLSYLGWRIDGSLPMSKTQVVEAIIATFVTVFVGIIGVFVAILVTASIMPQTFAPGAIDLLLSKPISRSLLYATKYFGGCMFTLINACYVIIGLWLIAGLRFGEWSNKLLLCIPIFLFLFAIYYAVSALAGVVWRNPIVSVVLTVLFWAICWGLGVTKSVVEGFWINPQRLVAIVPAGDELIVANEVGQAFRWDQQSRNWQEILVSAGEQGRRSVFDISPPLVGPVYDPKHDRVLAIVNPFGQFGPTPDGNLLRIGQRADDWQGITGVAAPSGTTALFIDAKGSLLAVSSQGLFRLQGDPTEKPKQMEVFGIKMPTAGQGAKFALASPALRLHSPLSAAIDRGAGALAVFDGQTLLTLAADDSGRHAIGKQRKLDDDERGVVALVGDTILVGLLDGRILVFDSTDLSSRDEFQPFGRNSVRSLAGSKDGRYFAATFADGRLWLYDARERRALDTTKFPSKNVSAAAFDETSGLLIADHLTQVAKYQLSDGSMTQRYSPSQSYVQLTDQYLLRPLYAIFPKPGELDNLIGYLLSPKESAPARSRARDAQGKITPPDLWGPVWSNLAFIAAAVLLGCWYTSRKDF